jgi:hypothetical protein
MSCPSEDDYALMLEGALSTEQAQELERHIDRCAPCMELVAELGKVFGGGSLPPPAEPAASTRPPAPEGSAAGESLRSTSGAAADTLPDGSLKRLAFACLAAATAWTVIAAVPAAEALAQAWPLGGAPIERLEGAPAGRLVALLAWAYALISAPLLLGTSSAAWLGARRGSAWARRALAIHAWLGLPSLVLVPLSLRVLMAVRRLGDYDP